MLDHHEISIIRETVSPYGPMKLGVFGSHARNEEGPNSDVDLLVEFSRPISLLDLVGLEQTLSELLKKKVEMVTTKALSDRIRQSVMKDLRTLL